MRAASSRDAAGFAATAASDLRLDHQRASGRLAGEHVAAGRNEYAGRNGNSVRRQELLAVVLDQEHESKPFNMTPYLCRELGALPLPGGERVGVRGSTRDLTRATNP